MNGPRKALKHFLRGQAQIGSQDFVCSLTLVAKSVSHKAALPVAGVKP
jgi:hypothetical protein